MNRKTITITEVSTTNGRYLIKDQDNKSYSFFETKQDKTPSKAAEGFKNMNLAVNSTVGISYDEKPNPKFPSNPYKNIMFFYEPTDEEQKEAPAFVAPNEVKATKEDDKKYWEAKEKRTEKSMRTLNAKKGSCEIVSAMINAGFIDDKNWFEKFDEVTQQIYDYEVVDKISIEDL